MKQLAFLTLVALTLFGCGPNEQEKQAKVQENQTKACVEDTKLGLNDPNSIEVIRTEPVKMKDETHRLLLEYTAKNAMGGRVRGESVCGFKTVGTEVLNPDDFANKQRELARLMRKTGLR
jgi:hypothetical protein